MRTWPPLNMADPAMYRIPTLLPPTPVRRKVFVSYFRADRLEVEEFVDRWADEEKVGLAAATGAPRSERPGNSRLTTALLADSCQSPSAC
jgi:hypothetical protein